MRRALKFDGVAVAGIGMVRFGMHAATPLCTSRGRRPARAPRRRHDAGRRRRGVRRLHPAGVDDRHQGHEGARADGPPRHPRRERVGHRSRRLPRGGVGRVVGPGRRRDGAVLRQVHRHGEAAAAGVPGATQIDAPILPAAYFALWAQRRMHERGTTVEQFATIAAKNWNYGAACPFAHRRPDHVVTADEVLASRHGGRAAHRDDVLPARRRRGVRDHGPRGPRAVPPARPPAGAARRLVAAVRVVRPRPHVRRTGRRAGAR